MLRYAVLINLIPGSCRLPQVLKSITADPYYNSAFTYCLILQQKDLPLNTTETILKKISSEVDAKSFFLIAYTTHTILELIPDMYAILFIKGRSSPPL